MRGDPHQVRPRSQVVDDPLDGDDGTPSCRERPPNPFEERGVDRDVAVDVGDGGVQERDVGHEGRQEPDRAERGVHSRVGVVVLHRRVGDGPGGDGREPPRRRLEPLREGEERPVLDLDHATLIRLREDGVRREVREGVAGVARDDAPDQAAPEEQCAQAREAQHLEREAGVAAPPLADDLAGRGRPTAVAHHDVERVAGTDVLADRLGQGPVSVGHPPQAGSSTRSANRRRCQPW